MYSINSITLTYQICYSCSFQNTTMCLTWTVEVVADLLVFFTTRTRSAAILWIFTHARAQLPPAPARDIALIPLGPVAPNAVNYKRHVLFTLSHAFTT